uniref:Uncharacterized protein n=1 Tax=Amphiprion percula TaxID=161767 RepID=A0A3P8TC18_AMPPE
MTEAIRLSNPSTGISTVQHSKYNKSLSFIRDFILERDYTLVTSSDLFIREFIQERNHTNSVALHPSGKHQTIKDTMGEKPHCCYHKPQETTLELILKYFNCLLCTKTYYFEGTLQFPNEPFSVTSQNGTGTTVRTTRTIVSTRIHCRMGSRGPL